jgi:hypothetical protein
MDNGPVVSRIYDLIREAPPPGTDPVWRHFISAPSNYEVSLTAEPEIEELSPAEESLIEEIFAEYVVPPGAGIKKVSPHLISYAGCSMASAAASASSSDSTAAISFSVFLPARRMSRYALTPQRI